MDSVADDALGLVAGLAGLSRLVAGAGTLEQLLTEVANFAKLAVPDADGVRVTMLEAGEPDHRRLGDVRTRQWTRSSTASRRRAVHLGGRVRFDEHVERDG